MKDWLTAIGFFGVIVVLGVSIWLVASFMEAKTYTKLTGKPVSTWDAMWIQLRVQEPIND
jgi:hypothetical protein